MINALLYLLLECAKFGRGEIPWCHKHVLYLSNSASVCILCTMCYSDVAKHSTFQICAPGLFCCFGMGSCACSSGIEHCGWAALQTGLDKLHVPYSYGWSIILLTLLVKTALFPITRKQVSSREEVS